MTTCPDCQSINARQIAARAHAYQEPGKAPDDLTSALINMKMDELRALGYVHNTETQSMVLQCAACKAVDEQPEETASHDNEVGPDPE